MRSRKSDLLIYVLIAVVFVGASAGIWTWFNPSKKTAEAAPNEVSNGIYRGGSAIASLVSAQDEWALHYYYLDPGTPQGGFGPPLQLDAMAAKTELLLRTKKDPLYSSTLTYALGFILEEQINQYSPLLVDDQMRKDWWNRINQVLGPASVQAVQLTGRFKSYGVNPNGIIFSLEDNLSGASGIMFQFANGQQLFVKTNCGGQPLFGVPNVPKQKIEFRGGRRRERRVVERIVEVSPKVEVRVEARAVAVAESKVVIVDVPVTPPQPPIPEKGENTLRDDVTRSPQEDPAPPTTGYPGNAQPISQQQQGEQIGGTTPTQPGTPGANSGGINPSGSDTNTSAGTVIVGGSSGTSNHEITEGSGQSTGIDTGGFE